MIHWGFLLAAGILEIGWAISLKMTDGYTKYLPLLGNVALGLAASFCLAQAMRSIPVVIAYPVWKGVAILGLVMWDAWMAREGLNAVRVGFALLILTGIIGLKLSMVPSSP